MDKIVDTLFYITVAIYMIGLSPLVIAGWKYYAMVFLYYTQ